MEVINATYYYMDHIPSNLGGHGNANVEAITGFNMAPWLSHNKDDTRDTFVFKVVVGHGVAFSLELGAFKDLEIGAFRQLRSRIQQSSDRRAHRGRQI